MAYTEQLEAEIQAWALARIKTKRHEHVQGVVDTADALAAQYLPAARQQARLAGWMHDAAKVLSDEELLQQATHYHLAISESERLVPMLLHGVVGYLQAADAFNLDDKAIMTACRYHTAGHPQMQTLDKIVFVADLIEPSRDFPDVDRLREVAYQSLDQAVLLAADRTLQYLVLKGRLIAPDLLLLRNRLLQERQKSA